MLIGNVGKDPEVRYLDSNPQGGNAQGGQGRKVATFTLATSERYRDRNGELKENTEWHNIVAWGQPADIAEKYIKKGTQVYIEGRLRTRSWTDQTGNKRYTTEINVDTLQLLGRRDSSADGESQPYQPQGGYQQGGYQQSGQQSGQAAGYQQPAPARAQYFQPGQAAQQAAGYQQGQAAAQQPESTGMEGGSPGAGNSGVPDDLPF